MHSDSYSLLDTILQGKGDLDGTEAAYGRALEIDPKYTDTSVNLGAVLKGNLEGAEFAIRKPSRNS